MNRSEIMRSVKSQNTTPELLIRSLLHRLGFRFRLHRKDLPGSPDIVLPRYRAVIFVHGCFWHRHPGCRLATTPKSRQDYWLPKFMANIERDHRNTEALQEMGWQVIVVWECEIKKNEDLEHRLKHALTSRESR
ncbi:very short patch repair endonuclease [Pseudomonas aeruginosa]|uniref:very short patch repair endonuclease n=2 Tax=Pseudomonas aeruginosa TaxID=287 RepID=UPI00099782B6|nr:DNA mismatch endonuclease Vsr [Pseudomonas aeruginosa]MDO7252209.1 DNA mismatch endonuclease Vsr [Pseudomonas aeruginosa]MDU0668046.1 DNA mismatch endonuclease Vsr [Pseudomonas aeruginosa]MDX4034411.1 DNA mismatch endonuclease Vsr [Pseudomonas aeruginosa]HCF5691974.1 DNA mismatch endonuclease Vsr [Pseudomonas aeruginosa]HCK0365438.1 DNA mismatch endonuclease Vsr [Pseudomonas aeruginosa]